MSEEPTNDLTKSHILDQKPIEEKEKEPEKTLEKPLNETNETEETPVNKTDELDNFSPLLGSELFVLTVNNLPKFYVKTEKEAQTALAYLGKKICTYHPDWNLNTVHVGPDEIHIERNYNWFIISYPEIIRRVKYTKVVQLVDKVDTDSEFDPFSMWEDDKDKVFSNNRAKDSSQKPDNVFKEILVKATKANKDSKPNKDSKVSKYKYKYKSKSKTP